MRQMFNTLRLTARRDYADDAYVLWEIRHAWWSVLDGKGDRELAKGRLKVSKGTAPGEVLLDCLNDHVRQSQDEH